MNSKNTINKKEKKSPIKLKDHLKNIKSEYFLPRIFDYLNTKVKLEIIKFNKNIKNKINININNYKEYSEIYSSIEIEIIPVENGEGKFININKEDEKYYHIYFNNNKNEIKKTYLKRKDKVSKINIIINHQIKSFRELFYDCKCIKSLNFKKALRNNLTDMYQMFNTCTSLIELNLSNLKTTNVTDMGFMFMNCWSLKILNISNFNTKNVTDMSYMFFRCSSIKQIYFSSNFIVTDETNMKYMFEGSSEQLKSKMKNIFKIYLKRVILRGKNKYK